MILLTRVLLLLSLSRGFTEVVDDFTQTCPEFFVNPGGIVSPPTVFEGDNYKQICQVRYNTYEYATFYDTNSKIPVYSAYKFEGFKNCTRKSKWYTEPQLEDPNGDKRMRPENRSVQYNHQAVNADYTNSGYSRGHVAPVFHSRSQSCAIATFTLTNVAPQHLDFNKIEWLKTEWKVAKTLNVSCNRNYSHIVTGVVPGTFSIKNRVKVPSHFWTAYCCLDNNQHVTASRGFLGKNINIPVLEMSVSELDIKLSDLYGQGNFKVFGGNCDETIIKTTTAPTTANTPTTPNLPSTTTIPIHRLCQRHLRYLRFYYRIIEDMHTVPNMQLRRQCRLLEKCLPHHVHQQCQEHQLDIPYSLHVMST